MNTVSIVYWSGTGNTEIMANAIFDSLKDMPNINANIFSVNDAKKEFVQNSTHIILGCPSMGAESLEDTEFEPFINTINFNNKIVALFGSYGWGDGEWMRTWEEKMKKEKFASLIKESLIINETPDSDGIKKCHEFGKSIFTI